MLPLSRQSTSHSQCLTRIDSDSWCFKLFDSDWLGIDQDRLLLLWDDWSEPQWRWGPLSASSMMLVTNASAATNLALHGRPGPTYWVTAGQYLRRTRCGSAQQSSEMCPMRIWPQERSRRYPFIPQVYQEMAFVITHYSTLLLIMDLVITSISDAKICNIDVIIML